jgi:hypothetical protein
MGIADMTCNLCGEPWRTHGTACKSKTVAAPSGHAAGDGSLDPLVGCAGGRKAIHPNCEEALKAVASVAETLSAMDMPFASRQLHNAVRTLADHLTKPRPASAANCDSATGG